MSNSNFLVRLHGYEDLVAGNIWSIPAASQQATGGRFGGKVMRFANQAITLTSTDKSINFYTHDFTVTSWIKAVSEQIDNVSVCWCTSQPSSIFLVAQSKGFNVSGWNNVAPTLVPSTWKGQLLRATTSICDDTWHYLTVTKKDTTYYIFIDGKLESSLVLAASPDINHLLNFTLNGYVSDSPANTAADIDDFCILDGAMWTEDFTPPTDYLSLNKVIYLSGNEVYGVNSSGFSKLADDYTALTDAQKIEMYDNIESDATVEQLYTVEMPINAEICAAQDDATSCVISAKPHEQLIIPDTLTNITKKINLVSINAKGNIKVAMTKDGNTYQVYNFTSKSWEIIDIDEISTRGMDFTKVEYISDIVWQEYNPTKLGFAFSCTVSSSEDECYINKVVISYDEGEN